MNLKLLRLALAGAPMTFVPYAGFSAGLQDLLGGRVSVIVSKDGNGSE